MSKKIIILAVPVIALFIAAIIIINELNRPLSPAPVNLSEEAQRGKTLFLASATGCNNCHPGEGRKGTISVPALSASRMDDAILFKVIREGKGTMPGNTKLSDAEINQIVAYINALKAAV
jgi:cytochrome c553